MDCYGGFGTVLMSCISIQKKNLEKIHVDVKQVLAGEEERRRIALEQRGEKQ
jgi:hypothetical protein